MRSQEYYESKGYKNASEYYKDVKWEDTGYVSPELSSESTYPDYIKDEVEQSVKSILSYQSDDTVTFGFMTDLHYATTHNHCIRMKRMLNAYREIKKQTHSSMLLLGGDLTNEGCKEYKAECFRELRKHFEGIDYLPANGNHDDGSIWDISYINAEKSTNHLIQSERYDLFYNHLPSLGAELDNDNPALYYMYNDTASKTRYISLDSEDVPYIMDNGKLRYSAQWIFAMSQKQIDWLINKALKFDEEGWSIVFFMHSMNPPKEVAAALARAKEKWYLEYVNDIADAYTKGEHINAEYYDSDFKISVNADFTNGIKADIIGFFIGDFHRDMIDYTNAGIPKIFTGNSVTYRGGADKPERNDGDKSEMLFDVITVNKKDRKIHITRVGCGDDREAEY